MKKIIILILGFSLFSCENSKNNSQKVQNLLNRIDKLENQNKNLTDSLTKHKESEQNSLSLIGFPEECKLKVGKQSKIKVMICKNQFEFPKYDIYKIENGNEIKIGENTNFNFDYEFTPKSINDNHLNLKIKMPYNGEILEMPILMDFEVEK
jgi:predicted ribosome quality control (RQC) complex YloA/Tae2 family protein